MGTAFFMLASGAGEAQHEKGAFADAVQKHLGKGKTKLTWKTEKLPDDKFKIFRLSGRLEGDNLEELQSFLVHELDAARRTSANGSNTSARREQPR
jgi:hypothetical protein